MSQPEGTEVVEAAQQIANALQRIAQAKGGSWTITSDDNGQMQLTYLQGDPQAPAAGAPTP